VKGWRYRHVPGIRSSRIVSRRVRRVRDLNSALDRDGPLPQDVHKLFGLNLEPTLQKPFSSVAVSAANMTSPASIFLGWCPTWPNWEFVEYIGVMLSVAAQGDLHKDPPVWLDGARPPPISYWFD
jgi:hypothetical protein